MPFDISRLASDIERLADYYARKLGPELDAASHEAGRLLQDVDQAALREAAHEPTLRVLAFPEEEPGQPHPLSESPRAYRVLASDGSAIDPDLHFPARYAIVHAAVVGLAYDPPHYWTKQRMRLRYEDRELEIVPPGSDEPIAVTGPVVTTLRSYQELQVLWEGVDSAPPDEAERPLLAMSDAILLWLHRGTGPGHDSFRDDYLMRSIDRVNAFQQAGVPLVSFTSSPHHREVVNTLLAWHCPHQPRLGCSNCADPPEPCRILRDLQDRHLFAFLPEGARSTLFRPIYRGDTRWRLPEAGRDRDPRLAFCYIKVGPEEIARLELPLWVLEAGLLPQVQGIVVDQCRPLRAEVPGYPVALTLAHREAVLTSRDRRAVQLLVEEALARRRIYHAPSAKARMKEW